MRAYEAIGRYQGKPGSGASTVLRTKSQNLCRSCQALFMTGMQLSLHSPLLLACSPVEGRWASCLQETGVRGGG